LICSILLQPLVLICVVMRHNINRDRNIMMETNSRLPEEQDRRNNINSCYTLSSRLSCNQICTLSVTSAYCCLKRMKLWNCMYEWHQNDQKMWTVRLTKI
jgi:hypothetical protein